MNGKIFSKNKMRKIVMRKKEKNYEKREKRKRKKVKIVDEETVQNDWMEKY